MPSRHDIYNKTQARKDSFKRYREKHAVRRNAENSVWQKAKRDRIRKFNHDALLSGGKMKCVICGIMDKHEAFVSGNSRRIIKFRQTCNSCAKRRTGNGNRRRKLLNKHVQDFKVNKKCAYRGCDMTEFLEFDHMHSKEFPVSRPAPRLLSVTTTTDEQAIVGLNVEMRKCQLLCVFHHRVKSRKNYHNNKKHQTKGIVRKHAYIDLVKMDKGSCENPDCTFGPSNTVMKVCQENVFCFDFDHINELDKTMNISRMIKLSNKQFDELIDVEIKKCQLLCCYCHRQKTYNN